MIWSLPLWCMWRLVNEHDRDLWAVSVLTLHVSGVNNCAPDVGPCSEHLGHAGHALRALEAECIAFLLLMDSVLVLLFVLL